MDKPKITVLLSVYNGERYIAQAVDSVLNQTFADFEFLILNDGSTDGTAKILESYTDKRIRIIHLNNRSLTKNLNIGIEQAQGKYIARMDADDICHPERFEKQFAFMEENADCVALGTGIDIIDNQGNYLYTANIPHDAIKGYVCGVYMHQMAHPAMMLRTKTLKKIGGYRHYFELRAEDRDILYRLSNYGTLRNITESLLQYRVHGESITNQKLKTFDIAHKHTVAYILHNKNKADNKHVHFNNWTMFDYVYLYYSTILIGMRSIVANIIKYIRQKKNE